MSVKNTFDIYGKCFSYLSKWLYLLPLKTFAWDDWEHFWEILLGIFLIPYEIFHAGSQFVILRVNLSNVLRNICQRIWFKAGMTLNVILMKQEVVWRQTVPFFLHTFTLSRWLWSFSAGCNILGLQIFPKFPLSREDDFMGTVFKSIGPAPCILPWSRGV